jgi:SpoVK/Ycf46/Vps4 family AAA+-type ATPase
VAIPSVSQSAGPSTDEMNPHFAALLPALYRLDRMLAHAVRSMESLSTGDGSPAFRGLYVGLEEVGKLLARSPAATPFSAMREPEDAGAHPVSGEGSPIFWLMREFELSSFDADVLLLSLAPEMDLRYEKIYAYLQDDVTRKRPTVELALNLLCPSSAGSKLDRRVHFYSHAPLVRNGLVHVGPDPSQPDAPFLSHTIRIDDQIVRLLLGQTGVDPRLSSFCELIAPLATRNAPSFEPDLLPVLIRLAAQPRNGPFCAYFQGPGDAEKMSVAERVAASTGSRLLRACLSRTPDKADYEALCRLLLREARVNGAVLYISEVDEFDGAEGAKRRRSLFEEVAKHAGIVILAGRKPWEPQSLNSPAVIPVDFEAPGYRARTAIWKSALAQLGHEADADTVSTLASRFKLAAGQIEQAASAASLAAQWQAARKDSDGVPTGSLAAENPSLRELAAAARSQCGRELSSLARKIDPKYKWDDIVLPADHLTQLQEVCSQAQYRQIVYGDWGFDQKLSLGKGLNVLFCGPPGTGKTMAAEVLARELQLDLYRIDLSQVVSKYIGETEKNLNRIFSAADSSNAILLFDEADALFGKRSEVRDSHDRYANIEISYLLQKMEEYEGVSILATNLRQNLDDAFVRRLQFIVEFPFPDEEYRRKIWENVFPKETPLGADVRFDVLAREVRLAGGNIKNMALAAAFFAAAAQDRVRMEHLIQAAHREHQKLGRSWSSPSETAIAKAAAK